MTTPGPLLGVGRGADVYDVGDGRVLRRYRSEHDSGPEAAVMVAARAAGAPVPEVFDVEGRDLVMQRLDGPTMLDHLASRPWTIPSHARTLAELHRRVGDVPTTGLALPGDGPRLAHGDLHPDNVILTDDGPMIIDWTNARATDAHVDAALTWLVLAAADPPGGALQRVVAAVGRRALVGAFRSAYGAEEITSGAEAALAIRLADPGLADTEKTRMRSLIAT